MICSKTYLSVGDFIDLFYKIKQKGYYDVLSKFHLSDKARTVSKWNSIAQTSDFWIIPEVRERWNVKCTSNPNLGYEDYVVSKYFSDRNNLRMLSIGCGSGSCERKFGKYPNFKSIEGIDMAAIQIAEARSEASKLNLKTISYVVGDFENHNFEKNSYDVILFNSSLHHFNKIDNHMRSKVLPLLKEGGFLIIFEFVGPKRLQWTKPQLDFANNLLDELPVKYKGRLLGNSIKKRIYRPGLWRMLLVDPSEAIDSESILPSIHKYFRVIEEKKIGWDISHLLFKDIAHNFLHKDQETSQLISYIFEQEDKYLTTTGRSDAIFGVYQKSNES